MMVERLFLAVPRGCLQFVIVVFPDHTHLLFLRARLLIDALGSHAGKVSIPDLCPFSYFVVHMISYTK